MAAGLLTRCEPLADTANPLQLFPAALEPLGRAEGGRPTQTAPGHGLVSETGNRQVLQLLPGAKPSCHSPGAPTSHSLIGSSQGLYQEVTPAPGTKPGHSLATPRALGGDLEPVCRTRVGTWQSQEVSCVGFNLEQSDHAPPLPVEA